MLTGRLDLDHRWTHLVPLLAALSLGACGDDGGGEGAGSTGDGSTSDATADPTTNDPSVGTTSSGTTADDTTGVADSSGGESSSEGGESSSEGGSSSSGGEVEVCAPELGLYADADCEVLAEDVWYFEPEYKLWSDGLVKFRYVYLPDTIDSSDANYWSFPVGTVFWKHFETEAGMRLETRRYEKVADDVGPNAWVFETYEWNESGDAVTAVAGGSENVLGTDHDIPAIADCSECHNGGQGGMGGGAATHDIVLGFSAMQLNHADTEVTLTSLMDDDLLSSPIAVADAEVPGDATAEAALGYMHANCGHCHGGDNPSGGMRLFVELGLDNVTDAYAYTDTVDVAIGMSPVVGIPDWRILPGDPDNSAVLWRMEQRDGGGMGAAQMPPLATEMVDDDGVAAVEAWILSLD